MGQITKLGRDRLFKATTVLASAFGGASLGVWAFAIGLG